MEYGLAAVSNDMDMSWTVIIWINYDPESENFRKVALWTDISSILNA